MALNPNSLRLGVNSVRPLGDSSLLYTSESPSWTLQRQAECLNVQLCFLGGCSLIQRHSEGMRNGALRVPAVSSSAVSSSWLVEADARIWTPSVRKENRGLSVNAGASMRCLVARSAVPQC